MATTRLPYYGAGLVLAVVAALAGCSGSASSAAGSGPAGATAAASSPLAVVKLAAKTASGASSFTGTMSMKMTAKPGAASGASAVGDVNMSATFAEQLHPSLLASVDIGTLSAARQSLPGGIAEILTPSTLYLKWSFLTTTLHLGKPWLSIPVSSMSKNSGVNLSQIFSQVQSSGPLTETQLLAGASSVHQVGTGTVGGVPVTEYSGTIPLDKGIGYLSGSLKAQVQQAMSAAGISTATFTVWIDGQHLVRKSVVTESGKSMTEVITTTITSINQPVNIAIPPASQTTPMPSAALGSGSSI